MLFPPLVRAILLDAAAAGLIAPRWSARVLSEWRIAAGRRGGAAAGDAAAAAIRDLETRFPDAAAAPDHTAEVAAPLPDPADAHVLAAAAAAGAQVLLTFNLADFPRPALARLGIALRHPDGFLWELHSLAPAVTTEIVARAAAAEGAAEPAARRRLLRRAGLGRLARALG